MSEVISAQKFCQAFRKKRELKGVVDYWITQAYGAYSSPPWTNETYVVEQLEAHYNLIYNKDIRLSDIDRGKIAANLRAIATKRGLQPNTISWTILSDIVSYSFGIDIIC